jgi:hypothetical protein
VAALLIQVQAFTLIVALKEFQIFDF